MSKHWALWECEAEGTLPGEGIACAEVGVK